MTELPEPPPRPLSKRMTRALGRAALAGMLLEQRPCGGLTVRCPGCSIGLALYPWPWRPDRTARRVERFVAAHRGHGRSAVP
jgi:hypothetical protein